MSIFDLTLAGQQVCEACSVSHLKEMPALMGKAKTLKRLPNTLDEQFDKAQKELWLPAGDFPSMEEYRETLTGPRWCRAWTARSPTISPSSSSSSMTEVLPPGIEPGLGMAGGGLLAERHVIRFVLVQ